MAHENIIYDMESKITAEVSLYEDGELEIVLCDKNRQLDSLVYYCNVNDFANALQRARAKLDI
jgi:hypothetical protein